MWITIPGCTNMDAICLRHRHIFLEKRKFDHAKKGFPKEAQRLVEILPPQSPW
jgi:hypothetical protein